jgi:hypothetical protein
MKRKEEWLLGGMFVAIVLLLQSTALFWLDSGQFSVCNAGGAWPFLKDTFFGNIFVPVTALFLFLCFAVKEYRQHPVFLWASITVSVSAVGVSHILERLNAGCVLDYLPLGAVFVNGGDILLTLAALAGIVYFWKKEQTYVM